MALDFAELDISTIPPAERILLAQLLLDSVLYPMPNDLSPEQLAELESRVEDIEAGRVVCSPWEDARRRLRERL